MSRCVKRLLSWCLTIALVLTAIPFTVTASASTIYEDGHITYRIDENGATVLSCSPSATSVALPDWLTDCYVTAIAPNAFDDCDALEYLYLPYMICSIGDNAFSDCTALQNVMYSGDETAFAKTQIGSGNEPLLTAAIEYGRYNIQTDYNQIRYALYADFTAAVIGFEGYDSSYLPIFDTWYDEYTVTAIAPNAFATVYNLYAVGIPATVTSIGDNAFANCTSLNRVEFRGTQDEWNAINIGSGNDALFMADLYYGGTTFEEYDSAYYALLPDGTARLLSCWNNSDIVIIPDDVYGHVVTEIHHNAFYDVYNPTEIQLPGTLTSIGNNAFQNFYNLQTIRFGGSEEQWNAMQIADGNDPLYMAEIYFGGTEFRENHSFTYAVLPNNTVTILGCHSYDETVTIPATIDGYPVTTIGTMAFCGNTSIRTLDIRANLTSVKKSAFSGAYLETVFYHGSETDWNAIQLDEFNESLTHCTRYYNVSEIVEDNGSIYLLLNNNTAILYRVSYALGSVLTIPEYVQGCPVTTIADRAVPFGMMFEGISIPRTVTVIYDYAFADCYPTWVCYAGDEYEWYNISVDYLSNSFDYTLFRYNALHIVTQNNIRYVITTNNTAYVLDGYSSGYVVIPDTIDGLPVTAIGDAAFRGCYGLTDVIIGDNVTLISDSAFESCLDLSNVVFGKNVEDIGNFAFLDCHALSNITFGDSIHTIGCRAFAGTNIATLELPSSICIVGTGAFTNCPNLQYVMVGSTFALEDDVFENSYPKKIFCQDDAQTWYDYASRSTLTFTPFVADVARVIQQDGLYYVLCHDGTVAFADAPYDAVNVTVAETVENMPVTAIAPGGFYQNSRLQTVALPDTITGIGDYAFYDCHSLTDINLPEGLQTIGFYSFAYCTSLQDITIPSSVTSLGYLAFNGCTSLTSVTIGEGITTISDSMFYDCTSLATVYLPASLTAIGYDAFGTCSALTDVYYADTIDVWNTISISEQNDPLCNATLHTKRKSGDLDGDNTVSTDDARIMLSAIMASFTLTDDQSEAADFNQDGKIDSSDVRAALRTVIEA